MTATTALVTAMAAAGPILIAYVILIQVPNVQHSLFRHQLWALRDEIVDEILAGRLKRDRSVEMLLSLIETGIHDAPSHTMMSGWVAVRNTRHFLPRGAVDDIVLSGQAGPERHRVAEHLARYRKISEHHLKTGAPSGWAYWSWQRLRGAQSSLATRAVEVEIAAAPTKQKIAAAC